MNVVMLVITVAIGTPFERKLPPVEVPTMKQCQLLLDTPAAWWTLMANAKAECVREFKT